MVLNLVGVESDLLFSIGYMHGNNHGILCLEKPALSGTFSNNSPFKVGGLGMARDLWNMCLWFFFVSGNYVPSPVHQNRPC